MIWVIHLKLFVLLMLLTATGLANANLIGQNIAENNVATPITIQFNTFLISHQNIQYADTHQNLSNLLNVNIGVVMDAMTESANLDTFKTHSMYAKLFSYVSHTKQIAEQEGLSTFWKGTVISNAIDAVIAQKHQDDPAPFASNPHNIKQIAADSLNDQYTRDAVNEVPLPAAAWLFTSAIILFGFSRRNNI